jgi:hypothetical protein
MAQRLDAEVARRLDTNEWATAPHPVTVRENQRSEIYIG